MESLEIIKGSDRPIEIQLLEEDSCGKINVFDLVNYTEIKAIFKKTDGLFLEKLETTNGIEVISENNGEIKIVFEQSETSQLKSGKCISFEIEVTKSIDGGTTTDTYIWPFEDALNIKERLK